MERGGQRIEIGMEMVEEMDKEKEAAKVGED